MSSKEGSARDRGRQFPAWIYRLVNSLTLGLVKSHEDLQSRFHELKLSELKRNEHEQALREQLLIFQEQSERDRKEIEALKECVATLSERATAQDHRSKNSEERLDRAEWGREALVERLNFSDAREELLALRITEIESRLVELRSETSRMTAMAWDNIAMTRRLGVLEDRTETLLNRLESEPTSESLVAYPMATKAAG